MSTAAMSTRPPLVALVYRANKGCQQYPFGTADELEAWAARHPYRNETLKVHPVAPDGKFGTMAAMPAGEAAAFVRKFMSQPAAKHTAGPWKVRPSVNGTSVDSDAVTVAFCGVNSSLGPDGWYSVTHDEAAANARLCAAALDLLEALQAFMSLDKSFSDIPLSHVGEMAAEGGDMAKAVQKARRAIAKATGGAA